MCPRHDAAGEVVEHQVFGVGADDEHEMVPGGTDRDLREQQRGRRPSLRQQALPLGDRIIVAVSGLWRDQPDVAVEAEIAVQGNDRGVDNA